MHHLIKMIEFLFQFKYFYGDKASKIFLFKKFEEFIMYTFRPFIKQKFGNLTDASAIVNNFQLITKKFSIISIGFWSSTRSKYLTWFTTKSNWCYNKYSKMVINKSSSFYCISIKKKSIFLYFSGISTCNACLFIYNWT